MSVLSENLVPPSMQMCGYQALSSGNGVFTSLSLPFRVTQSPGTSAMSVTSASHVEATSLSTSRRNTSSDGPRGILASGTAHPYLFPTSSVVQETAGAASCVLLEQRPGSAWALMFACNVLQTHFPVAGRHWAASVRWGLAQRQGGAG